MMEHEAIRKMLALYAADALEPDEMKRVGRHAENCEICRSELLAWGRYARGLTQLEQPGVPAGLVDRTRAQIFEQRQAAIARRHENALLAALVVFGWAASLATWIVIRILSGGSLHLFGANLLSGMNWSLASTMFAWMTAAAAATILARRNELEFKEAL